MAKIPIDIAILANSSREEEVKEALIIANAAQEEFIFSQLKREEEDHLRPFSSEKIVWEEYQKKLLEFKKWSKDYHPHLIAIVDIPLESEEWLELFSQADDDKKIGVITI